MKRPDFDKIKTYAEFQKYNWNRSELSDICRAHGLLFVGSEKKLNKVIESYFNGVKIPPRRNWYTNPVLTGFVNENGLTMSFDFCLLAISLIIVTVGIINNVNGTDNLYYVPHYSFGGTGLFAAVVFTYCGQDLDVLKSYFPSRGSKRFTRAQVDAQANSDKTVHLKNSGVLLAPDMLIGVSAGVAAIAYEDVVSIQVRQRWHSERIGPRGSCRYKKYYTYEIVAGTKRGRRVTMSKSLAEAENEAETIYKRCLVFNPEVKLLKFRKSPLAPDDSARQIVEGKGVAHSVDQAIQMNHLVYKTVDGSLRDRFISFHRNTALALIPESLLVAAVAAGIMYVLSYLNLYFLIVAFLFPLYAVYNLIKVLIAIRRDDMDFYYCEITDKSEKGYSIKGVLNYRFGFIKKLKPDKEPGIGDRVIIARFMDEYSLISDNGE